MNLVAKEYVAARDDEDGVLVLSKFTGAAVELRDALVVNPYDIAGVAEAIHEGLEMSREERRRADAADAAAGDGAQYLPLGCQRAGRPAGVAPGRRGGRGDASGGADVCAGARDCAEKLA